MLFVQSMGESSSKSCRFLTIPTEPRAVSLQVLAKTNYSEVQVMKLLCKRIQMHQIMPFVLIFMAIIVVAFN